MRRVLWLFAMLLGVSYLSAEENKFEPLPKNARPIDGRHGVRINNVHPLVVRNTMQVYGLFRLTGTANRAYEHRYKLPDEVAQHCGLGHVSCDENGNLCIGTTTNGKTTGGFLEIQLGEKADTVALTDDKNKASKFLPYLNRGASTYKRYDVGQTDRIEHYQFEFLQDGKPTGKFLAFEKENSEFNKDFILDVGARLMILSSKENAATLVFSKFEQSGK